MRTLALLLVALSAGAAAAADRPDAPVIIAQKLAESPKIDGMLDDRAWTAEPVPTGEWRSYNPLHGDTIPQNTRVWVAYDAEALYFAFQCDDPEPDRHQDVGSEARQHRRGRLGGSQPGRDRHRPDCRTT